MATLTVACIRVGAKYGPEYVSKLASMASRHIPEHQFVCFTDDPQPDVPCRPALCDYPGFWQKVGLFRPGVFRGPVLYLDLDVVIHDRLDGLLRLLDESPGLWALDDWEFPLSSPRFVPEKHRARVWGLLGGPGTCNSSVMLWDGDVASEVWALFRPELSATLAGDQNWITQCLGSRLRLIPPGWAHSYKEGGCGPILVCHGEPKPPQIPGEWRERHWR
jgi:hypothetical protein